MCPKGISERAIRRSLEHLEQIGWIKRFLNRGRHGNYPTVIARYSVHDRDGKEYRVNADATIDWRNPILEPFFPSSGIRPRNVRETATDREVQSRENSPLPPVNGGTVENGLTHDDLLKDDKNYARMSWGGQTIIVKTGRHRRIISRNTAESFAGATAERMVEHLNRAGFWAAIYKPDENDDPSG